MMRRQLVRIAVVAACLCTLGGCSAQSPSTIPRRTTVTEAVNDSSLSGRRVEVSGAVAPGSWNGKTRPMTFAILDPLSSNTARVSVTFDGPLPETFGDDRELIVVGTLTALGKIEASAVNMAPVNRY